MLTVGSLFSGIGGIDLGLERTGQFRTIWMAEIDNYASKVLAKHWPDVPNLGNVKEINYERLERPDVLIGGYPCQPFSLAGQRNGASDPRHLWPECLRALRVLRPRYAVFENVRGHLSLGFSEVLSDFAAIGFDAEWQVIPAASVGAPHRRDRLFIVAYPNGERLQRARPELKTTGTAGGGKKVNRVLADSDSNGTTKRGECAPLPRQGASGRDDGARSGSDFGQECVGSSGETAKDVADGQSESCDGGQPRSNSQKLGSERVQTQTGASGSTLAHAESSTRRSAESHDLREVFRQASKLGEQDCTSGTVGDWWQVEPDVGRVANGVPSRVDRLRALGNAVVPQVAEMIGYMIAEHAANA